MAQTTTETLRVNGVVLNTYAKNIETLAGRLRVPARRSSPITVPGRNGVIPPSQARRRYEAGMISLPMWVSGCDDDGGVPTDSTRRIEFYKNVDALTELFSQAELDVEHTLPDGSVRRCNAFVSEMMDFSVEGHGDPVGKFSVLLEIPESFWEDQIERSMRIIPSNGAVIQLSEFIGGTAPMEDLSFEITGPVNNIRITSGGTWFEYRYPIPAGATLRVFCRTWTMFGTGLTPDYRFMVHAGDPRWLVVKPNPFITVTGLGMTSATRLTVRGRRKYLVG